jgi:hypothetical protein
MWALEEAASQTPVASVQARLVIACLAIVGGAVLAFDFKGVSSRLLRANSRFSPWGKKRERWAGPNPACLAGAFFLIAGIATLVTVAVNP